MLPSEMIILMAIAMDKNTGKKMLARPMDITGEYISFLYQSLVNRGYLKKRRSASYKLTAFGRGAMAEFLRRNKTRGEDVAKRLRLLGIEISPEQGQKLVKIEKEAIKVT